jgi:ABC-type multidrug transport system fused ATPase/permease subunit
MKKKFSLSSLGILFTFIKPHRFKFTIAMIALGLGSGVNLLFPEIIRRVLNSPSWSDFSNHPSLLALILIGLFALQGLCFYVRILYFGIIGQRVVTDLRSQFFDSLIRSPIAEFDSHQTGDLVSRLMNDTSLIQEAVSIKLSVLIRYTLQIIVGVALMVWISWALTLAVLAALIILTFFSMFLAKKLRAFSKALQEQIGLASGLAEDAFSSIRVIRGFRREDFLSTSFQHLMERSFMIGLQRTSLSAFFQSFVNFLLNGCLVLVLLYGIFLTTQSKLQVGDLTAFLLYGAIVAVSFAFTTSCIAELAASIGGADRVLAFLQRHDASTRQQQLAPAPTQTTIDHAPSVSFRAVSFQYPGRTEYALNDVSFDIPAGKKTALVGVSGAGKSTVVNLMLGFYQPTKGDILINGIPAHELADQDGVISFVPQDPRLLNLPLYETIRLGDESISDEVIRAALDAVHMTSVVEALPEGIQTKVGEGGTFLSGGQRQRVAIARALVRHAQVLILDEATASLDTKNEQFVHETLERLPHPMTQLVISHRLSTIKDADYVIVLAHGRVIQSGSFQELSNKEGFFREYIRLQTLIETPTES